MKQQARQVIGYIVGGTLVLGLIPLGLWKGGDALDRLLGIGLDGQSALALPLAALCLGIGGIFGIWAVIAQNTLGGGGPVQVADLDISPRTTRLVVAGPYRFTRNPMLLGAFLMYLGFSFLLESPGALLLTLAFLLFMLGVIVPSEERRLARDFGEEYVRYKARVNRFFPGVPRRGL